MKLKICLLGLLCLFLKVNAQENAPTTLKIGEIMPDILMKDIINSNLKSARLSDFKGKVILIDFWSTHCGSCIAGFSGLDSLQKVFAGKLQVLLVNKYDSKKQITMLVNRLNSWSTNRLKLPIVQDTVISKYFKFRTIPACAWISPDGHLVAFTEEDQVTGRNIEMILKGERVVLPFKDDFAVKSKCSQNQNLKP